MPSAAVIRELMNLGLAGDDLLAAIERIESAEFRRSPADSKAIDEQAERRRERDRLRKSAERLRKSAEPTRAVLDINTTTNPTSIKQTPPSPSKPERPQTADEFEARFWTLYPRKAGKGAARRAWKVALGKASADEILAALQRFAAKSAGADTKFIPHPASWLNGERWLDADLNPAPEPEAVSNGKTWVKYGGALWDHCNAGYIRENGKSAPTDTRGGWYFDAKYLPSEYPQEQAA